MPFKILSSYVAIVIKSPSVNKQSVVPFFNFTATILLFITTFIMYKNGILTLKSYIIVDLVGYACVHFAFVCLYYKSYYLKFVKNNYVIPKRK